MLLGGIGLLLIAFHFWFVRHAETLIEDLVRKQSKGKVELRVHNFKFNWFSRKMELEKASFFSTDTSAPASYLFNVKSIKLEVQSVWALLMDKKFLINTLQLYDPTISVTRRTDAKQSDRENRLSIPQEMGRIYNSIQDALRALQVDQFQIFNGSFSLANRSTPDDLPVNITRIDMELQNLRIDSTAPNSEQKILFSDNVSLQTHNQNIHFPDGVHRLAFRDFHINLQKKLVEFDSCTIEARRDSSANSFRIFFDKLQMTNIDFDTLYHAEVIKADSVYAFNPRIQLNVELSGDSPVAPPRLDELLQQLTGELDIGFVVVENGSFDINTVRDGSPTSFTSADNNFSIQGLRVREDGERPVSIEKFAMAIRNYETFIRDSAYAIYFDSILVNDNRISLSNFTYSELEKGRQYNELKMRQLELYGLSWDELVFHKRLKAEQVTLLRPVIHYDITQARNTKNRDVFDLLAGLSKALQLQRLHIVQGEINLKLPGQSFVTLNDATVLLETRQLLQATSARDLRDAVQYLDFQKGKIKIPDWDIDLHQAQFEGGRNRALADQVVVKRGNKIELNAQGLEAPLLTFNEYMQLRGIHGLKWKKASLVVHDNDQNERMAFPYLYVSDLNGLATDLNIFLENGQVKAQVSDLKLSEWKYDGEKVSMSGLGFWISNLLVENNHSKLSIDSWREEQNNRSTITNLQFTHANNGDSIEVVLPAAKTTFLWNEWVAGKRSMGDVTLHQPLIRLIQQRGAQSNAVADSFSINQLEIVEPDILVQRSDDEGSSRFAWKAQEGDSLRVKKFFLVTGAMPSVSAGEMSFHLRGMEHNSAKGKRFQTGRGLLKGELREINANRNDLGSWYWKATVHRLHAKDFEWDSLGKNQGRLWLESAEVRDLRLQTSSLLSMPELVRKNPDARIDRFTGSFSNKFSLFNWHNVGYDNNSKTLSLDSFRYTPTEDHATFNARQQFQADYIKAHTGAITMGPIELETFARDTVLSIGLLEVKDGYLDDYRDKRIPREPGIVRALPAGLLKKIPFRFRSDSIRVVNSIVRYEEFDDKTQKAGSVMVTELNGSIKHARNYDHSPTDTLRIYAQGNLAGSIATRLWVNESYTDSLGGFRMHVDMEKGDLSILNPVLAALANVELKSGKLDSLRMDVIGREAFAYGNMRLYYDKLKVRVVKGNPRSLGSRLMNFVANTLIQNRSKGNGNLVYVDRLRDRSAINYLVKITLSGVMTNVGIKKPVKEARKNRRQIKELRREFNL